MFYVIFSTPGGELDRVETNDGEGARLALISMLEEMTELGEGDTFTIVDSDDYTPEEFAARFGQGV